MLVTLFSDGFSDFIKEVKKKKILLFLRKKTYLPKAGTLITVLPKKPLILHFFFLIEISLVENNSVLWQTKKMLLRFFS